MNRRWPAIAFWSVAALLAACAEVEVDETAPSPAPANEGAVFAPPDPDTIPATAEGDLIRFGHRLVTDTRNQARAYVGNELNCANCHLDAGRRLGAAPFVGLTMLYPEYRARNARMNTLEDRLDDCFERSMNGRPLPRGGREQRALVAYITWLSQGVSKEAARSWRGFHRIPLTQRPDPL